MHSVNQCTQNTGSVYKVYYNIKLFYASLLNVNHLSKTSLFLLITVLFVGTQPRLIQAQDIFSKLPSSALGLKSIQNSSTINSVYPDIISNPVKPGFYKLGPGDIISIGVENVDYYTINSIQVNSSGEIVVPDFGIFSVTEKTISEAESFLVNKLKKRHPQINLKISLDKARKNRVYIQSSNSNIQAITLDANYAIKDLLLSLISNSVSKFRKNPLPNPNLESTYTRSVDYTQDPYDLIPFNASEVSGSDIPKSVLNNDPYFANTNYIDLNTVQFNYREIIIKHKDGTTEHFDLIKSLYTELTDSMPAYLLSGDIIFLPESKATDKYIAVSGKDVLDLQIKFKDSSDIEIVEALLQNTDSGLINVFRNGQLAASLSKEDIKSFTLNAGDHFVVPSSDSTFSENISVTIKGNVFNEGIYSLNANLSNIQNLIDLSGGALPNADISQVMVVRNGMNRINNRVEQLLLKSNSPLMVEGLDYLSLELMLQDIEYYSDFNSDALQNGDIVYVLPKVNRVKIIGQVVNPGAYNYDENATLSDYLTLAGGLSDHANKESIFIIKQPSKEWVNAKDAKIEAGDWIFINKQPLLSVVTKSQLERDKVALKQDINRTRISAMNILLSIANTYLLIRQINK